MSVEYDNPPLPEGINDSPEHPLRDVLVYGVGIIAVLVVGLGLLFVLGGVVGHVVPFAFERRMVAMVMPQTLAPSSHPVGQCLQAIADRIVRTLPPDRQWPVVVAYDDGKTVNAFAAPGGRITLYRGLLEKLPDDNAVAAVIAHEIAHIQHRDVLGQTLGQILSLTASHLIGGSQSGLTEMIVRGVDGLVGLYYSRAAETGADLFALEMSVALYGHGGGLVRLMNILSGMDRADGLELLHSHPDTINRLQQIEQMARVKEWPLAGQVTEKSCLSTKTDKVVPET